MSYARRLLPSMSALRILEAMDRLDSVSAAAEDLALTQGAVSRQIQALETQLGVKLAQRDGRRLVLTPRARAYAAEVRASLNRVAEATLRVQTVPLGGTLSLAILPAFGMRWLMPRLPDFARLYPDITINMATRLEGFAFSQDPFDAAIRFGDGKWPGCDSLLLKHEALIPVAAPDWLLHANPVPAEISRLPLLHIRTRPDAWADWFRARGVAPDKASVGTWHDQFSTIIHAASHGLGAALLPDYLIQEELATRQLVALDPHPMEASGAYYLVWPSSRGEDLALKRFRDWLVEQAEPEDPLPR